MGGLDYILQYSVDLIELKEIQYQKVSPYGKMCLEKCSKLLTLSIHTLTRTRTCTRTHKYLAE